MNSAISTNPALLDRWQRFSAAAVRGFHAYANWLVTTLAAVFGTGALSPISAAGLAAQPWQESLVTTGFMSVGLVIVATAILVLWGLGKNRQ